nr:FAD-dependent oxidoreductase [Gordonia humi]
MTAFDQAIAGDAVFDTPDSPPRRLSGNPIDVPSFRFGDGAQSVPVALADRLGDDVVSLANPVHRVEIDGDRVAVHAARGRFGAQHVVVAVPPPLAVETITITPDLDRSVASVAASTAVWMGQTVKAVAVYDEPFWRQAGLAGSVFSHRGPFREIHDHSGPGSGPGALFGFAPSTAFRDGADIPSAFIHQLTRVFGEYAARPLDVVAADWRRERFTSPAAAAPRAGTASYGHSVFQAPVHGRLHWAATETATAFAGHVEGAILAAAAAVDRIERAISMI